MLTHKEIDDYFQRLSGIDTRDEGALAIRNRLVAIGVEWRNANTLPLPYTNFNKTMNMLRR